MKYTVDHPSKDFARALGMDKKAEQRIMKAVENAFSNRGYQKFDDLVAMVAPYIHTAEEGFFAAITMQAHVAAAKNAVYSKNN